MKTLLTAIAFACMLLTTPTTAAGLNAAELAVVIASAETCKFRIYQPTLAGAVKELATADNPGGVVMLRRLVEADKAAIMVMSPVEIEAHCNRVVEFAGTHGLLLP